FVTNLIDDQPVPVYGDGLQIRDWLHAEDHARGILHVLERGKIGEIYNLGGGNPRTNMEITQSLIAACGRSMETHVTHVKDRPGHDRRYAISRHKAAELGWQARISFADGLAATVQWYQENEAWWRPLKSGEFRDYYQRQYTNR
ncbi:MAG: GDP-mannose 4,6-dehydratase, partial [Vulcanimicrobiaceae bacterium]